MVYKEGREEKRNEGMNYRQLKTKGVLAAKTAVRAFLGNTLCYLPYIGWVPKPSRKNGISVMIRREMKRNGSNSACFQ